MKLNVKLTADELMDVVDAAVDAARERDYMILEEELVKDMTYIVDAALSAMGIEVVPADEDDEDEEEDNDPIADMLYDRDDGRTAISLEDAYFLMDMIKENGIKRGLSEDEAIKATQTIFIQICKDYGIDVVEEEEEEEEEVDDFGLPTDYWSEFDEEEVEPLRGSVHDPIAQMLFTYDGKVTISQKNAMEIVRQMTEMIEEQGKGLTGEQKTKWLQDALTALADDYGIEYVLNV